ncbi:envelope stress response membrane protein PspB [Sphingomonas baiyangensis]|uniref:Envelope stress response membrane protein PspB n=1 Tax=Sphingomonas baiyangensis TaxID=2572576 RepID=A0A4U1L5T5_9SPHN|nr:envelope stress response membrane protein PspB [Sphingomonas baiyangensis]TKD52192.1 envelope stress response membrane protein PspB [Sphingomonas baiyangensis]
MEDILVPIMVCGILFVGMPWIILHYLTKWKQSPTLTGEDEKLLDELHHMARRLDERIETIERIVAADNPDFRPSAKRPETDTDYDYSRRN